MHGKNNNRNCLKETKIRQEKYDLVVDATLSGKDNVTANYCQEYHRIKTAVGES